MRVVLRRLAPLLVLALGSPAFAGETPGRRTPGHHAATPAVAPAPASSVAAAKGRGRAHRGLHGAANINQADEAMLQLLPGVGEVTALRIVEYRKAHPFRKVEDITKVKGIGRKKMARMRAYLSVSGPSTLAEQEAVTETAPEAP